MDRPPRDVLVAHTYYRERGGEDEVFEAEAQLLESRGHHVTRVVRHNADVRDERLTDRVMLAANSVWSRDAYDAMLDALRERSPAVVHVHNTLPQLSAAIYDACRREAVPVVQTLHNYRVGCVNGLLFRDGRPCEDCVGRRVAWPGVVHRCYRSSPSQSAVVAASSVVARAKSSRVAVYVAPTEFARSRFIAMGLPADKIVVKPNFVADPGARPPVAGDYFLFVGRLSPEKGIDTLIAAARRVVQLRFVIVGDGPLRPWLSHAVAADGLGHVTMRGALPLPEVLDLMRDARAVIVPSSLYETFGRVVIEAFACATPVVASRIGALAELVTDDVTGVTFTAGDSDALESALRRLTDDDLTLALAGRARRAYERHYTPAANYERLREIYDRAVGE